MTTRAPTLLFSATLLAAAMPQPAAADDGAGAGASSSDEIVITATRREQALATVAESVTAFTAERMETLGAKSFAELAKFTSGVDYDPLTNNVAVRGIGSTAGAGVTGIYIDDAPVQMRALYFYPNNTLPYVFDLARVEVLRGPQGTLFGAGSVGGAIRYITNQPSLTEFGALGKAEVAVTENAGATGELGIAAGGPIVTDKLGVRASAWVREEGGWIDVADPFTGATLDPNANKNMAKVLRAAAAWAPNERARVTLAAQYQERQRKASDYYWVALSDVGEGRFVNATPNRMADRDRFYLPSLTLEYEFDDAKLTATTGYFNRIEHVNGYSGTLYDLSYFQQLIDPALPGGPVDPAYAPCPDCRSDLFPLLQAGGINLPGFEQFRAESTVSNRQKNFTQEIRLQSTKPDARLVWQVGVFHARLWEHSQDVSVDPYLPQFAEYLFGKTLDDIWGVPQLPGFVEYVSDTVGRDTQTAVFADLTYSLTDQWKVNGGLRYTHARFSFNSFADGTLNFGRTTSRGEIEEKPLTPKVGVSFAPDRTQLYYVNAAKGFRIGGANPEFSFSLCQADLDELQLTSVPTSYDADTVWNYEAGARNAFLDGRVTTAMSVFRAEWSGIQQANFLPSCGFQYTANLGEAVSEGFDLQARARVSDAITVDAALGYTDARYSRDSRSGPAPSAPVIVGKGDSLGGAPWKAALGAQYDFLLLGTNAFARADYTFASAEDRGAEHDPRTTNYDPMLKPQPETHYVSVRAGTRTDGWNASFFVNNLFDAHPQLDLYHLDAYTELMEATTLRPRTIGVTLSYRR